MAVGTVTADNAFIHPRGMGGVLEGDTAVVVIVKAGDRPLGTYLLHSFDIVDIRQPDFVFCGPTVIVCHKQYTCLGVLFGNTRNESVKRTAKGFWRRGSDASKGHVQTLIISAPKHYHVISIVSHIGIADAHRGQRLLLKVLYCYCIAVLTVIVKGHFISSRHHLKPGVTLTVFITVKKRVTDSHYGLAAKYIG